MRGIIENDGIKAPTAGL